MLRAALLPVMNTSREYVAPVIRSGLEKVANSVEQNFTGFREAVRACPTFGRIGDEERAQIEREVFEVVPRLP